MNEQQSGVTLTRLKELQEKYRISASKALGQNFLVDPNIPKKIAELIPAGTTIEIGPGIGSLTVPLARHHNVVAIEYDKHILDPLQDNLEHFGVADRVEVMHEDVMNVDLQNLCTRRNVSAIVGNLPYNISATLIANVAEHVPAAKLFVAMVQKEVGERLGAPLGTREVSAISYVCQYFMDVTVEFSVARQSFIPQPRVDSVVISMRRHDKAPVDVHGTTADFFALIHSAFSQRRKMLRQSLKTVFGESLNNIFQASGVDPTLRPEQCGLEEFAALHNAYFQSQQVPT